VPRQALQLSGKVMLQLLRIENLALMEGVSLEFEGGFTAVTGETGAGKSILLGALALLAGNRADKTLIRQGAESCLVEAALLVRNHRMERFLAEAGLPPCDDNLLLLRRILHRDKASRIFINGGIATLAQLQALGEYWIDFHGPGEPQKLFLESEQLALLDLYGGSQEARKDVAAGYRSWRNLLEEIAEVRESGKLTPEEVAFLRSQLKDIEALQLSEERVQKLEDTHKRLSASDDLHHYCDKLEHLFLDSSGICERLRESLLQARKLASLDSAAESLGDRIESMLIEAGDIANEWAQLAGEAHFEPSQIKQIKADMEAWLQLRRRYGPTVEAVLNKAASIRERLHRQQNMEQILEELLAKADNAEAHLREQARDLRSQRLQAAQQLGRATESLLRQLGFKKPRLSIDLLLRKDLAAHGDCDCSITFAPNPGLPLMPLNKIASSGELARVMLAIKSVLAAVDATPVLVFDEVDANIGGEVATAVARMLRQLGTAHQVFCITHLPQVACVAKSHYIVTKEQGEDSTSVAILRVDKDPSLRLDELARMLGDRLSESARRHAEELLSQSVSE
jgi:DNA repair protein RecN (Recombination protein N)